MADKSASYKIVRMYEDPAISSHVIKRGLTIEQARTHCRSPEASSGTAKALEARLRTVKFGRWFDGFDIDN
jgi:hypothetical protein